MFMWSSWESSNRLSKRMQVRVAKNRQRISSTLLAVGPWTEVAREAVSREWVVEAFEFPQRELAQSFGGNDIALFQCRHALPPGSGRQSAYPCFLITQSNIVRIFLCVLEKIYLFIIVRVKISCFQLYLLNIKLHVHQDKRLRVQVRTLIYLDFIPQMTQPGTCIIPLWQPELDLELAW